MSYRTVKRFLGETSLEVKCRLLLGTGLMLLIMGSFYVYAKLNMRIIREQQRERAQLLVAHNILWAHWKLTFRDQETGPTIDLLATDLKPLDFRDDRWKWIPAEPDQYDATKRPSDQEEYAALRNIVHGGVSHVVSRNDESGNYVYFEPVPAAESCLTCHRRGEAPETPPYAVTASDGRKLFGVARLELPPDVVDQEIQHNTAILIATAIVTSVLAMLGASAIVRYVIVKPVQHLNEVSEAIAHGDLDQRADIRTGDDFEELSHAFNRMLRHLVTIQDELRQVNASLDSKVDELAQANLSLHEMNKLKSEFLATMSHELRTPLNSILGFSDVLGSAANLDERQRKYLSNIQTSGRNLLALINDILDLAKIEAGKMEVHAGDLVPRDLVENVVSGILPIAERKNIDLRWDIAHDVPVLDQDAGKLQQVLNNLLSNAVKFTPEGGRVQVQVIMSGPDRVEFTVADTGVGIPLDDQATIFDKFRQGRNLTGQHGALTREYEGTGLGLSIVRELSRLLGGEVFLESEFGKGSTFTVVLPVEAPLLATPPLVEETPAPVVIPRAAS
jgi:two-component system, NarL family, sensor histidine kinase BarA